MLTRRAGSSRQDARGLGGTPLSPGAHLGDFEIAEEIGRGGMGIVYRARQISLGRPLALKVLPGYARFDVATVQRFRQEALAAARLHHTNVVAVYAQGEHEGHCYYAMELIDGVSLDGVLRTQRDRLRSPASLRGTPDGPWTPADYRHIAGLLAEVGDALHCAHQQGVIHRDIKPHNLLLAKSGQLLITDFGLARLVDQPHLTLCGDVMGTPAYSSPEQARGDIEAIDGRTDVYSLGATLYEVITGRRPFEGTRDRILLGICTTDPPSPRRVARQIPVDLDTICRRAMAKDPARRYATAAALADDLRRFADGRRIVARRPSPWAVVGKRARRHPALVAGLVAVLGLVTAVVGWSSSTAAHHRREARQLLDQAYEQLAYVDYRKPEQVAGAIERAAALGADARQIHLVQALACLGAADELGAITHAEAVLKDDPDDARPWYLLSWAYWRQGERTKAHWAYVQAEEHGPPTTADAWFLRGLAVHFADPEAAIESYREASARRAATHGFYPQAVLHLARAHNQQMYAARSLEPLSEAVADLEELVQHGCYQSYPYYLLSISHRLAAEVYSGSSGTRGDALVAQHYAIALDWARRGQAVEPQNAMSFNAEAECLESQGHFAAAAEARTRAINVATKDVLRWEGYHYRWRLRYWLGDLDGALADLAACARCDPQDRYYAHVYPALVLADLGDHDAALEHARALADDGKPGAEGVLWSATCLRVLGRPDEARALLVARAATVDFAADLTPPETAEWRQSLYAYCLDGGSLTALEALAEQSATPWRLWGEAYYHAGALYLAAGDRLTAEACFERAFRSYDDERGYTYHGKLLLVRLRQAVAWPLWSDCGGEEGSMVQPAIEARSGASVGLVAHDAGECP